MCHIREALQNITFLHDPFGAPPFLVPSFSFCYQQDLSSGMFVPIGSCARLKGDHAYGNINTRLRRQNHIHPNGTGEICIGCLHSFGIQVPGS